MKKNPKAQAAGRLGGQVSSPKKTRANRKKARTLAQAWRAYTQAEKAKNTA